MNRHPKGSVVVDSSRGMLRLRLPRHLYGGEKKFLYLGLPDTPLNRQAADAKAQAIAADIAFERFDPTLEKYKFSTFNIQREDIPSLHDLWAKYKACKSKFLSTTTIQKDFKRVENHIINLPTQKLHDARKIRKYLIENLSTGTAKKILMELKACCKWALEEELISSNPFATLPPIRGKSPKKPIHPFTREERDLIITAFEEHPTWHYYAPLVRFFFFTGCRTSEAVGLQWKHLNSDLTSITFSEALVQGGIRKDTKTHTIRRFPINSQLRQLLLSLRPNNPTPDTPVFISPQGLPIDAHNFLNRAWRGVLQDLPITYRPQYNTRHSFISLCLESGVQVVQVASWVGNSPKTIWNHYAGLVSSAEVPPQ